MEGSGDTEPANQEVSVKDEKKMERDEEAEQEAAAIEDDAASEGIVDNTHSLLKVNSHSQYQSLFLLFIAHSL